MIGYQKLEQTKKNIREEKVCSKCGVNRKIKFFEKPTSKVCNDCKLKSKRVKKQSSPGKLREIKDKQWALDIKERDGFKCLHCGKDKYLNSHHIFTRNNYAVRWDMDNGITLCSGCHTMSSIFSAHKTPLEFIEWIREFWGEEWYERLRAKARVIKK